MTARPTRLRAGRSSPSCSRHRGDALIASGLGSATWDCFAAGDSPEYLYSWGGMGLAVPTALGLALAQPGRRVVAITGDGEIMMGLGSLAVVGDQAPEEPRRARARQREVRRDRPPARPHLRPHRHRRHGQGVRLPPDHDGDRAGRGRGAGALPVHEPGPVLGLAKIAITEDPWALPEKDGATIAHRFRTALGLEKA